MGNFNGGCDWNGNGKNDAFDNYMDMNLSSNDASNDDRKNKDSFASSEVRSSNSTNNKELKGISMGGKQFYDASKDSDSVVVLKCVLAIASCIGGVAVGIAADAGSLGAAICIFGGIGLGILIMKNN